MLKRIPAFLFFLLHILWAEPSAVFDYSSIQDTNFTAELAGSWLFYPGQLYHPDSLSAPKNGQEFHIPGHWRLNLIPEKEAWGYGSFSATVIIPPSVVGHTIALYSPEQVTSYTVWINGKKIVSSGQLQKTLSPQKQHRSNIQYTTFLPEKDTLKIWVNISNFAREFSGGFTHPLQIGTSSELIRKKLSESISEFVFIGILIAIGIIYFFFFLFRRKETTYLFFAILNILWALRFTSDGMNQDLLAIVFTDVPNTIFLRFEGIAFAYTSWIMVECVRQLYSIKPLKSWSIFLFISSCIVFITALIGTENMLPWALSGYQICSFLTAPVYFYALILAIQKRENGSLLLFIGSVIFMFTVANDSLKDFFLINVPNLANIGVICLSFCYSIVLSRKFANALHSNELLTERLQKSNEGLQSLDRLKDEFMANTSHELRTPLQGIIGISESMSEQEQWESMPPQKAFRLISASGKRLSYLINDIQDSSSLKHNRMKLEFRPVDLKSCSESIIALLEFQKKNPELQLKNEIESGLPLVQADQDRLEQILYNLLGNAIKYTPEGSVTISAWQQNDFVHVSVQDTGQGIALEAQSEIFEPYDQVHSPAGRKGTGLGLFISKQLVEKHGGQLILESEEGRGSIFTFTLPVASENERPADSAPLIAEVLPETELQDSDKNKEKPLTIYPNTILVVDDELINREVLRNFLSRSYQKVLLAASGKEALQLFTEENIDLVILDIMMPGMNGFELLKEIRADYSKEELPVLFLSAGNRNVDLRIGFEAGANDYLNKPCSKEELLARVRSHLALRENWRIQARNQHLQEVVEAQKKEQEEAYRSYKNLQTIFDHLRNPIWIFQGDGSLLYGNDQTKEVESFSNLQEGSISPLVAEKIDMLRDSGDSYALFTDKTTQALKHFILKSVGSEEPQLFMLTPSEGSKSQNQANSPALQQEKLKNLPQVAIQKAVHFWEKVIGKSKAELAAQSGLWTVHVNPDGWERTRTLDRYLHQTDFPKYPRVKTIMATLAFVMQKLPTESAERQELEELYQQFLETN